MSSLHRLRMLLGGIVCKVIFGPEIWSPALEAQYRGYYLKHT